MSLICVKCGKIIVMSNNPEHYGVCAGCDSDDLTPVQQAMINKGMY